MELDVGGRAVRLSNPDKVYFPEKGYTKRDVAEYFLAVGPGITRALNHRPTTLQRFVDGVEGDFFYQKRAPKNLPEWIPTARIAFPSGRPADEICPTELAAVIWAANLGTLTFHPWP
ncbi:ATP-dependent DNA ligase, partial [Streptomyces sp. SID7499]|nr:ATP-dependent DNA ligase [Streptomyces sp. SID7499]